MHSTSKLKLFQQISRKTGLTLGAITLCSGLIVVDTQTLLNEEPTTQTATMLSVEAVTAEFAESYTVSRVYSGEVVAGRISELGFERSRAAALGQPCFDWLTEQERQSPPNNWQKWKSPELYLQVGSG